MTISAARSDSVAGRVCLVVMIPTVGPIPGSLICEQYNIDPALWPRLDPCERAMFRMAYAADVMHVQEDSAHTNHGPEVERVLRLAGVDPGNPWCASIETAYLIDSGVLRSKLPIQAASVHGWGDWADAHKRTLETPRRACVGLIYHTASTGHLVVVTQVLGSQVATIEGNTNLDGSRDGFGVFRRRRPIESFARFVDVRGLG